MPMKTYDAVIAGYICVDLIPDFKRNESHKSLAEILRPGRLIEIDGLKYTLGGVVANTGAAMKKFDKKVFLNGIIGQDFIGKLAKELLEKNDLLTGILTVENEGTAFGIVLAPSGTDRIFLESPGSSRIFDNAHINFKAIADSRLFHFGYPPLLERYYLNAGTQLKDLFSAVNELGVVTSLDFSLPDIESQSGKINWLQILKKVLPFTDIFVPSLEEAFQIMKPAEYQYLQSINSNEQLIDSVSISTIREIGEQIIRLGAKVVLIKAGHRGACLVTGDVSLLSAKLDFSLDVQAWSDQELWCDAFPVDQAQFKNASGAGDTATAAFLSSILNGENPESSLRYAAMAGRNNLYCFDIYDELRDWQRMTNDIKIEKSRLVDLKNTAVNMPVED